MVKRKITTEMRTIDEMLVGCKHDGSYIPVDEVRRLMAEYAGQYIPDPRLAELEAQGWMWYTEPLKIGGSWAWQAYVIEPNNFRTFISNRSNNHFPTKREAEEACIEYLLTLNQQ